MGTKQTPTAQAPAPDCAVSPSPVLFHAIALFGVQQGAQTRQERFQVRVYIAQALQVPR